jgi:hypothetical protein
MQFYVELVKSKDKQIEKLNNELNKIKSYLKQSSKYESKNTNFNYLTAFMKSYSSVKGENKKNSNYNSGVNIKIDSAFKFIKEKPGSEIYSDRVSNNNSLALGKALNDNYKSVSNNSSTTNLVGDSSSITNNKSNSKGKKAHYSTHNCFRKSNTKTFLINNPKHVSNINSSDIPNPINLNNFFKGFTLSSNSVTLNKDKSFITSEKIAAKSGLNFPVCILFYL